ncbi:MAG: polymer-forming cytoskeletal protein [Lachnospiraceae bacterium]
MSFFKDIKDELEQAVNEIDTTAPTEEEELDLFAEAEGEEEVDEELLANILEDEPKAEDSVTSEPTEVMEQKAAKPEVPVSEVYVHPEEKPLRERVEDKDGVTVITKGTTINGSIISDCSLEVMGTINGDIECLGKLTISGKVSGNSMASEVFVNTDRLEGSITSEGSVKIAQKTVVIGDITASSAVLAGAVKGEIDVTGPVVLDSTAIIKGNIKAKSVQMNNGAVMEGFCSLSYSDVPIDDIFE